MRLVQVLSLLLALLAGISVDRAVAQSTNPPADPSIARPSPGERFEIAQAAPAQTQPTQSPAPPAPAPPAAPTTAAPPPAAAPPPVLDVEPVIKALVQRLDAADKLVVGMRDRDDELGRMRGNVEGIMYESTQLAEGLRPRLAEVKGQIDKLGPPPKSDGPPESAQVLGERARLNALSSAIDGAIKTTELTWVKARQLIEHITDLRHALFAQSTFQRLQSPLTLSLWRDVYNDWHSVSNTLAYVGHTWIEEVSPKSATVMAIVVTATVLYLVLRQTFRMFTRARKRQRAAPVSFFERAAAITWFAPLRAIAPIFAVLLLYVGLDTIGVLHFWADKVLWALVKAVLIFSSIAAVIVSVMAPGEPSWRLVPLANSSSRQISGILQAIAGVFAFDLALAEISRTLTLNVSFNVVETIIANLAMASLLSLALLTRFAAHDDNGDRIPRLYPVWLKGPIWLVVAGIVGATFAGYIALGRFVAHQLVLTGVVLVVSGLLYLAIRAFTREPQEVLPVDLLESTFGLDERRRQTLGRLTELVLSVLLVMLAVPFILLQWGFSGADIRDWFQRLFFGFEIGTFRISLAKILLGIVMFIGLVLLTQLVQRWLKDVMLTPARLEAGLAHSIDTVLGYIGTGVAALIAISYAGFDITNLAILAGALSVGIGFGLQSIVNNFVSGLILLFERPIKVGDWIVVGGDEGHVRKISVRSTEIETFDRASIIVPNADLISGRVKNWTLRDAVGRQRISVSVRYEHDPAKARDLLLKLAADNKNVLDYPAPFVTFDTFGPDTATLSLNIFIGDVNRLGGAKSELSFAILQAFPAAGIPLAVPLLGIVGAPVPTPSQIRIPVPIAGDADLEAARKILSEIASGHPAMLPSPAPAVEFEAFTQDGVTLAVTAEARDPQQVGAARTDLALAIAKALRTAGISSPSPMHSVRLTDLEPLRHGLMQALEERRRREGSG